MGALIHGCRGHERKFSERVKLSVSSVDSPRRHSRAVRGKETLEFSEAMATLIKKALMGHEEDQRTEEELERRGRECWRDKGCGAAPW